MNHVFDAYSELLKYLHVHAYNVACGLSPWLSVQYDKYHGTTMIHESQHFNVLTNSKSRIYLCRMSGD